MLGRVVIRHGVVWRTDVASIFDEIGYLFNLTFCNVYSGGSRSGSGVLLTFFQPFAISGRKTELFEKALKVGFLNSIVSAQLSISVHFFISASLTGSH